MRWFWVLWLSLPALGCLGGDPGFSDGDADTDADVDSDSDTDTDADLDCEDLPPGPYEQRRLSAIASEDVAFDADGNVVGSDGISLLKSPYAGPPSVFTATVSQRAGLRFLPDGRLAVADDTEGTLFLVDADGTSTELLSGLGYPNGIAVDREGFIYLTEKSAGRIRRIDPDTGAFTILVEGGIAQPNGITFDPTYRNLYIVGTSGEGLVYRLPIGPDGTPGTLEEWARGVGAGRLDGLACDVCGYVYVCDYTSVASGGTIVHRISPDGVTVETALDTNGGGGYYGAYLANMDWGSGIGGWRTDALYFADAASQRVLEVVIGVPSKPRAYPP